MLQWVRNMRQLPFSQLMQVYVEGNLEKAEEDFGEYPLEVGLRMAEEDFYQYLQEVFFRTPGAIYALWMEKGVCVSALRLEPYRDGVLLSALETAPDHRRFGYGKQLVLSILEELDGKKVYSHVSKTNIASLALHESCGFLRIKESAVYLDGSVNSKCCTFCFE